MVTGPNFREEHVLDDGTPITLRHVRPDDVTGFKHAFERLSASSRYTRFHGITKTLSDEMLHYLTNVNGRDHVAIVAVGRPPNESADIGLGVARFIRSEEDPSLAEPAITVIDAMQKKGLGRILAIALARAALERGIDRFRGQILADNVPVRRLLDEIGAVVHDDLSRDLVFDVSLRPSDDHPSAMLRLEAVFRKLLRAASSRLVATPSRT